VGAKSAGFVFGFSSHNKVKNLKQNQTADTMTSVLDQMDMAQMLPDECKSRSSNSTASTAKSTTAAGGNASIQKPVTKPPVSPDAQPQKSQKNAGESILSNKYALVSIVILAVVSVKF